MFEKHKIYNLVKKTITEKDYKIKEVKIIKFKEGMAVIINKLATYYIKDNIVYAANGQAKALSKNIEYSKEVDVCYSNIIEASNET